MTGALALVGLFVLLGTGEALLRFRDARRPRAGSAGAMPLLYYRHRRLPRAFVRGADYNGRVHINRQGFRGADVALEKAPGTLRIIAVGASATFDVCAPDDAGAWPARLQQALSRLRPGERFEVINAGVPGYLMLDNIIRLQDDLRRYSPDVIVLYAGHGTVDARSVAPVAGMARPGDEAPDAVPALTPWGQWLERHSLLYNAARARLAPRSTGHRPAPTPAEVDAAIRSAGEEFRRDLTSFVLIAQGIGARVVLVELAHLSGSARPDALSPDEKAIWRGAFPASPEVALAGLQRYREVQREVADSLHATFVGVDRFGITRPELYCDADPLHVNSVGAERLADNLARELVAAGAVARRGATAVPERTTPASPSGGGPQLRGQPAPRHAR